jgi:hypothetical protein
MDGNEISSNTIDLTKRTLLACFHLVIGGKWCCLGLVVFDYLKKARYMEVGSRIIETRNNVL